MVCKRTIAYKLKKNREDQQANLISNELYHSAKILYRCYIHLNDYSAKKKSLMGKSRQSNAEANVHVYNKWIIANL